MSLVPACVDPGRSAVHVCLWQKIRAPMSFWGNCENKSLFSTGVRRGLRPKSVSLRLEKGPRLAAESLRLPRDRQLQRRKPQLPITRWLPRRYLHLLKPRPSRKPLQPESPRRPSPRRWRAECPSDRHPRRRRPRSRKLHLQPSLKLLLESLSGPGNDLLIIPQSAVASITAVLLLILSF